MTKLEEIEAAIAELPREDFYNLVRHLRARHNAEWDRQIEEDAESGKLDKLYRRLAPENAGQAEVALNDFLNDKELP